MEVKMTCELVRAEPVDCKVRLILYSVLKTRVEGVLVMYITGMLED